MLFRSDSRLLAVSYEDGLELIRTTDWQLERTLVTGAYCTCPRFAPRGYRLAAAKGAQIVCLQELFRSQYFCRSEDHSLFALAESIPGPSTDALGKIAKELGIVIVASLFERRGAGVYHNTAAVLGTDGNIAGVYRKMHIPDDPLYYEKFYFTPGDLGFLNFDTPFGRIGVLVCWDQIGRAHV